MFFFTWKYLKFLLKYHQVNEKTREKLYGLRQTWNEVFPTQKLYALDVKVNRLDQNWPITAKVMPKNTIHVNPNFLQNPNYRRVSSTCVLWVQFITKISLQSIDPANIDVAKTINEKQRELLELQKRKLELQLEATKKQLIEQELSLSGGPPVSAPVPRINGPRGSFPPQFRGQMQRPQNPMIAQPHQVRNFIKL